MKQSYRIDYVDVDCSITSNIRPSVKYRFPNFIDHRDFCLPTNNQGVTPHCVGYTVAGYLEVEYWKKTHIPKQFPADKIYQIGRKTLADSISGTRLEYCLRGLRDLGCYNGNCILFSSGIYVEEAIKSFIHTYGQVMLAFCITDEWYSLSSKYIIKEKKRPNKLGGHCVLGCGYCKEGIYIQNSWGYQKWGNYGFAIVPWNIVYKQFGYGIVIDGLSFNEDKLMEILFNESSSIERDIRQDSETSKDV